MFVNTEMILRRRLGKKRSAQPGIQAQRPRTRTARTTRQINGAIFCGGQPDFWDSVLLAGTDRVQRPIGFCELKLSSS